MNFEGYETERCFLSLVASVLNGKMVSPVPENISVEKLINVGLSQNMAPILFCALNLLKDAKLTEQIPELKRRFMSECIRSGVQMEEYRKLVTYLCGKGVKIMPLKGSVIKKFYPAPYMRVMSDVDLLYEGVTSKELSAMMMDFGYSVDSLEKGHHDVFTKKPHMIIELHRKLIPDTSTAKEFLSNMFEKAEKDGTVPNLYYMRDEDFYLYFVIHSAKHFREAGLGVKPVADFYVLNRKFSPSWDREYIENQLASLCLLDFERKMQEIAETFFGDGDADISENEFSFFFRGGTYGIKDTKWSYMSNGGKDRLGFLRKRIFQPYKEMCIMYPSKSNKPILLPLLWCRRGAEVLMHRRENLKKVLEDSKSISKEKAAYASDILKAFGLPPEQ